MSRKNRKFIALTTVLVIGAVMAMTGCLAKKQQSYYIYEAFDTETKLQFYATDSDAAKIYEAFETELFRYHELFDIYSDYDGVNNIKTINDQAGIAPVTVDAAIIDVLKLGQEIYEYSDGSTNIAMGSVLSIWHEYRLEGMEDTENAKLPPDFGQKVSHWGQICESGGTCDYCKNALQSAQVRLPDCAVLEETPKKRGTESC